MALNDIKGVRENSGGFYDEILLNNIFVPYTGATANVDLGVHNLTVDTNTLFIDSVNHRVGMGSLTPSQKLQVSGNVFVTAQMAIGGGQGVDVQTDVTLTVANNAAGGKAIYGVNYNGAANGKAILGYGYITSGAGVNYGVYGSVDNASSRATTNIGGYFTATATGGTAYALITGSGNVGVGTSTPGAKLAVNGDVLIKTANISYQENLDVDLAAAEIIASVVAASYSAVFFDYSIKNGTNSRSGTVMVTHNGTSVDYTDVSTPSLGDTSQVTFTVTLASSNINLVATTTTDNWIIKTLVRAI